MTTSIIKVKDGICLERLKYSYAHDIVDGMQDPLIHENTLTIPNPYFIKDALAYVKLILDFEEKHQKRKDWAIVKDRKMIGGIGLLYNFGLDHHASEIGYWLHRDHRSKGIMSKVITALSDHLFEQRQFTRIQASVFSHNQASMKALENAGFDKEGEIQKLYRKNGNYINSVLFSLCKE